MSDLQRHSNIGAKIAEQLMAVDINSFEQLAQTGSRAAWLRIKAIDPSACLNRLMSLEGAIQNVRWHHLSNADKAALRAFYHDVK